MSDKKNSRFGSDSLRTMIDSLAIRMSSNQLEEVRFFEFTYLLAITYNNILILDFHCS